MVDLAGVVDRFAAANAPRAAEQGASLAIEVAARPAPVPADEDQIAQVLQNLFDNALRYGRSAGSIHVSLRRADNAAGRAGYELAVADDGPGIAPEHLPRLTERFYRVDKARSRGTGGTGLGLAIVKHIVNRHRGALRPESEVGRGTTFRVWLPAEAEPSG